jgi:ATP-dependent helicase/nuclease subunit A
LLQEFDALGIEYSARGGALFLAHPVVRQYLLGLRALADRNDGVAEAALLRPPFFALDFADVVSARVDRRSANVRRARMEEAQAVVAALRLQRHTRSPGATARDLIERTALGRTVAADCNGRQTLAGLYEVAAEVDRRAALEPCDYDGATELFRSWAENPVFLDTPEPPGAEAVRVMTTHSAKGLEFPVVILWDGFQTFSERGGGLWHVEREGHAWALSLGSVAIEQPAGAHVLDREKQFGEQERRRLYYVAATRARDLLVLPAPLTKSRTLRYATTELASGADLEQVQRFETFRLGSRPEWAARITLPPTRHIYADPALQERLVTVRQSFREAHAASARPLAVPTAVTSEISKAGVDEEWSFDSERLRKAESERFGATFGSVVHRALELLLDGCIGSAAMAVTLAAHEVGLGEHLEDAEADVLRAVEALRPLGVGRQGTTVTTEYPLAMAWNDGKLLTGFVDLLLLTDDSALVIDFKTDTPVAGPVRAAYPKYAAQLGLYGEILQTAGVVGRRELRVGVLLTASGEVRWL